MTSDSQADWWTTGTGVFPRREWSFATDAPLTSVQLARESGEVLAADESDGVYLVDRSGQVVALSRGFHELSAIAWSDTGSVGAAACGRSQLCRFNEHLEILWTARMPDEILAVAIEPFGNRIAVSLANGLNLIYASRKKRIAQFTTVRPLTHLQFLASKPMLIGAAEYGLICCHELNGDQIWSEKLWSNIGDLAATGTGGHLYLAGFTHGVQVYDQDGTSLGSFVLEGTPNHVSTSYAQKRFAVSTIERHVYWLNAEGRILWATVLPEDICQLRCDPLGRGFVCGFTSGRLVRLNWDLPGTS